MAIQIKRTTEDIRKESDVILASGQPLYVTDTKQLYVGDGESGVNEMNPVGAANLQASGENSIQSINTTIKKNQPDTITDYDPLDPVYDPSSETFDISWVTKGRLNPSAGATGTESIAIGKGLEASGHRSTVFGARNFAGGWGDFAAGQGNYIKASEGAVFGACNLVDGSSYSFISGYGNSIQDAEDVADKTNSTSGFGYKNKISNTQRSFVAGEQNELDNLKYSTVLGYKNRFENTTSHYANNIVGSENVIQNVNMVNIFGSLNKSNVSNSTLVGVGLLPSLNKANPMSLGVYNEQSSTHPIVIGNGMSNSQRHNAIEIPNYQDLDSGAQKIKINGHTVIPNLTISNALITNSVNSTTVTASGNFSFNNSSFRSDGTKIISTLPLEINNTFKTSGQLTVQGNKLYVMKNHGTYSHKIDIEDGLIKVYADATVGDSDLTTITRKQITTSLVVGNLTGLASKATADKNGNDIVNTYATKTELTTHVNNKSNPHAVTKGQVGLGNVDNTSDATKKVNFTGSIASGNSGFVTGGDVYTELSKKADKATTLSGYGITDAYTKTEVNVELNKKANNNDFSESFDFLTISDGKLAFKVDAQTFTANTSFTVDEPYYNPVDVAFWKLIVPNGSLTIKSISGTSVGSTVILKNSKNQEFSGTVTGYNGNIPQITYTCKIQ